MLAAAGGCSLHNPHPVGSFERGAYYAERGNNVEAISALDAFVRHNPTDSLAAEAQYLKGMTYMDMKEYPLAAVEFQILRKDYPTSERVEDAYFQEGMAYYDQVGRIERDVTGAYEARAHFLRFLEAYPRSSTGAGGARAHLQEISDLLVHKRLAQIRIYRQLRRHQAVAVTLDDILAERAGQFAGGPGALGAGPHGREALRLRYGPGHVPAADPGIPRNGRGQAGSPVP